MDVYYINLDYRTDRRAQFVAECKRIGIPLADVYRFPAIRDVSNPCLGCTKSHLAVLKRARALKLDRVLICEDDLTFKSNPNITWEWILKQVDSLKCYDVVMLASNTQHKANSKNTTFSKILEAQTASGYIVHARFYDRLIACLEHAAQKLAETGKVHLWINDQAWKPLQPISDWFAFEPLIGFQRRSYSDLSGRVVDHGC